MAETVVWVARTFITMDDDVPRAGAVAVRDGRIVAVGSLDEVTNAVGDHVVDTTLADRVVIAGLIDQHLHPMLAATTLTTEIIAPEPWVLPRRVIPAAESPGDYDARMCEADARLAEGEWLFSWGYHSLWHGNMSRGRLDALVPDRPVAVWQRSCHEWYLNTAALSRTGITKHDTDGFGSASAQIDFEKGHFWENGWMMVLSRWLMPHFMTADRYREGLAQMVEYLHMTGVTAINEPGIYWRNEPWEMYQDILGADDVAFESTFMVEGRTQPARGLSGEEMIADARAQVERGGGDKVRVVDRQVKLFCDGAIISQLMQMNEPYLDDDGQPDAGHHGEWMMEPEVLASTFDVYWDADWQIHVHVNGDRGLEVLLGIIANAQVRHPRSDHRTVVVHFANSTEEQVDRIAALGAIVSANPYYPVGFADKFSRWGLGAARADVMVRSASVLRRGIPLSFHSDLPMCPSDPLAMAGWGSTRITRSGRVAGPEQRISPHDALRAVTIEAAYSWRREDELGSITPGKRANMTVLAADPLEIDPSKWGSIPVLGAVFEGRWRPVSDDAVVMRVNGAGTWAAREKSQPEGHRHSAGCGCDIAEFLARHATRDGWAA
ncbi:MAG: hypothetical protein RLY50_1384 [Actinomycetota bacterium]